MRSKLFTLALASAIGASGGCAWSDQRVVLKPTIPFARSDLAHGSAVELRVADERPRTDIGRRIGPGVGGSITTNQNLEFLMRDALADALHRYGFTIAEPGAAEVAILSVALRDFEYEAAREAMSVSIHAWGALEARCHGAARGYETFYREHVVRDQRSFHPTPEVNEALLNETFSGLLRKPLADRDLLDCLAGPQADRSAQTP